MDYFLARYYSSTQGRFTSPDEFTGGPDELFEFADEASANPTFYAELTNPQSLNKYQYCYNNPFKFVDPDGHQGQVLIEKLLNSPQGQRAVQVAGAAGAAAWAATSGAAEKVWNWLTTPNPNFKVESQCIGGLDCGQAYIHKSEAQDSSTNAQEGSANQGDSTNSASQQSNQEQQNSTSQQGGSEPSSGGTGNPFKGKTPQKIDQRFKQKGFEPKGPNPVGGKGGYVNPKTGRSYHIDPGGKYKKGTEPPHVDVNRPKDSKLPKKKFPIGD